MWRVWKASDDLSFAHAVNFLDDMTVNLHEAVRGSLEHLTSPLDIPAPADLAGADVMATLLTEPVAEPVKDLEHGLEIAGILLGLLTSSPTLVMTCTKYLIHDAIGSALANVFEKLEKAITAVEVHKQVTADDRPAPVSETSKPAMQAGREETSAPEAADRKRWEQVQKMSRGEPWEPSAALLEELIRYQDAIGQEPVSEESAVTSQDATSGI